jgi:hypothetical protein
LDTNGTKLREGVGSKLITKIELKNKNTTGTTNKKSNPKSVI